MPLPFPPSVPTASPGADPAAEDAWMELDAQALARWCTQLPDEPEAQDVVQMVHDAWIAGYQRGRRP